MCIEVSVTDDFVTGHRGVADDELIVEQNTALAPRVIELLPGEKKCLPCDSHPAGECRGQRLLLRHENASVGGHRDTHQRDQKM
jgi:hypothetical protein